MWPDRRITDLFGIELPIIQSPMAGAHGAELAIAVSESGGLGSLPCALLSPEQTRMEFSVIRQRTSRPINVNFFCHAQPAANADRDAIWKGRLTAYYVELGLSPAAPVPIANRAPFNEELCGLVEEFEARGCKLPFRTAGEAIACAGSSDRGQDHLFGHVSRGGAAP